jgi:hypothetical protein
LSKHLIALLDIKIIIYWELFYLTWRLFNHQDSLFPLLYIVTFSIAFDILIKMILNTKCYLKIVVVVVMFHIVQRWKWKWRIKSNWFFNSVIELG